jgi:hypothetical protein
MFARRRAESAKVLAANKAKAHADNHRRAQLAAEQGVHPAEIQKREQQAKAKPAEAPKKEAPKDVTPNGSGTK